MIKWTSCNQHVISIQIRAADILVTLWNIEIEPVFSPNLSYLLGVTTLAKVMISLHLTISFFSLWLTFCVRNYTIWILFSFCMFHSVFCDLYAQGIWKEWGSDKGINLAIFKSVVRKIKWTLFFLHNIIQLQIKTEKYLPIFIKTKVHNFIPYHVFVL